MTSESDRTKLGAATSDLDEVLDDNVLILEHGSTDAHYWRNLWRYRELLGLLALRDIKVRYAQAVLGAGWALIQPAVATVIFTIVFGRLARMPDGGVAYPLIVLSGLLPWQLFSTGLSGSSNSLVGNSSLVSKVYFPRLVVPLSALAVAFVDFVITLVLFLCVAIWFKLTPDWHWIMLPVFVGLNLLLAFGAGLWLSSLSVKYRDFRFVLPFVLQIGIYVSPVGFRTDFYPSWRGLLALNPMTGIIDGFRWCLLNGQQNVDPITIIYCLVNTGLILAGGLWYFRLTEREFADVI